MKIKSRQKKYTKEELIKLIKDKAEETGRTPSAKEMDCARTVNRYFGSWNKAIEEAGLKVLGRGGKNGGGKRINRTDNELIEIVKQEAKRLGRAPKRIESSVVDACEYRFGTWNNTLRKAGLDINTIRTKRTDEELLQMIKDKAKELKRTPTVKEMGNFNMTIVRRFGTWNKAVEKAGLEANNKRKEG